jgi:[protein-PII] uridylyltransferase
MDAKTNYNQQRSEILQAFCQADPIKSVGKLTRDLTRLVDSNVGQLWLEQVENTLASDLLLKVCLVAVGGYGRAELLPNSDIDLLVLLASDLTDAQRVCIDTAIEHWVTASWDFGLTISHSVRTINQALSDSLDDLATQTSLLEARFLIGALPVFDIFHLQFRQTLDVPVFWRAKVAEMRARHMRFDDTPYSLEPNCKESPGGLRDLHLIVWLSKAAGLGNNWSELQANRWLTRSQLGLIERSERWLLAIRAHLHIISKRAENRIVFDLQTGLAQNFGFKDAPNKRGSELLMQRYYLSARAIYQQFTLFLQKIELYFSPASIDALPNKIKGFPQFVEVNHLLDIVDERAFVEQPSLLLDVFYIHGKTPGITGFSAKLWDAILKSRNAITPQFRRDPDNQAKFLRILKLESGITHAIRAMNQTGVLGRYLPEFRKIIGQMQHDLFHIYTVDQHILTVVRNLRRFTLPEHMSQHELANQVMAEFHQPWLLYIAGLFHDIAKGQGGDHSDLGALCVAKFAKNHHLNTADTKLVVFLVRQHLTMSTFAQKEDLSDDKAIARFVQIVGSKRHLQALYLLTVADIRGTSPKVWNAWKDKLLSELYHLALHAFEDKKLAPAANRIESRQSAALKKIEPQLHACVQSLWHDFDAGYFLRHAESVIAWHATHILSHEPQAFGAAQSLDDQRSLQVMIYIKDENDLFAHLCAFFQKRQASVFDAQIYTTKNGMALDTFQITLPEGLVADEAYIKKLTSELTASLKTPPPLRAPNLGRLTARSRNFPIVPSMSLQPVSASEYVLKLTATDRSGVLYSIAYILRQMGIELISARIVTLGERLEDIFVLNSEKLATPAIAAELETELMRVCRISTQ